MIQTLWKPRGALFSTVLTEVDSDSGRQSPIVLPAVADCLGLSSTSGSVGDRRRLSATVGINSNGRGKKMCTFRLS